MNAPTTIAVSDADRDAQALLARCRDRRWKMLQQFGFLEIALQRGLSNPPKTFGAKIRAWIKEDATAKQFERLIPARNLIAHAFVQCVRADGVTYAVWEIADDISDMNCKKLDEAALNKWAEDLLSLIQRAVAAADLLNKD